ncbi:MAG TPA: hypothetical protein VM123_18180 [archaeon]|nr:hypothetical protein [archaeon]
MEENVQHPPEGVEAGTAVEGQEEDKALRKTYLEFREEARHAILSSHDREKYESLEPEEREFVDAACLYEFKSQKVAQQKRKVKLRDILLCRDVAQAYCSGKDLVGQYSEGMRILKNSETGSDTVKFVLGRRICSMLEKVNNLYSQHPRTFVNADLHKAETDLLNYINRLGRLIRDPLKEAKRIYVKLKERAGWEIPATAFAIEEDCDVPQLFFNRYADPAQLLLKDPNKPFRSDTMSPPLRLDFRIKNAVLIMAGENRFHLDKKRFMKVENTAAARAIMAKGVEEMRRRITDSYKKNVNELADKLSPEDDIGVRSIKEGAFTFFYGYTLKNLPNTAARADSTELFVIQLMEEENSIGCRGFCRYAYPPEAVSDDSNPNLWHPGITRAYKLRHIFNDIGTGKERLSMFATRMNQLLTEYLDGQLQTMGEQVAAPFKAKIIQAEARLQAFLRSHRAELESAEQASQRIESLEKEHSQIMDDFLAKVNLSFGKSLKADSDQQKEELIERILPRLKEETSVRDQAIDKLQKQYQALVTRCKNLAAQQQKIDSLIEKARQNPGDTGLKELEQQLIASLASLQAEKKELLTLASLHSLVIEQLRRYRTSLEWIKQQYAKVNKVLKPLKELVALIETADAREDEILRLKEQLGAAEALYREKQALLANIEQLTNERDETTSRIEDEIEVNRET